MRPTRSGRQGESAPLESTDPLRQSQNDPNHHSARPPSPPSTTTRAPPIDYRFLIPPTSSFARAVMGNEASSSEHRVARSQQSTHRSNANRPTSKSKSGDAPAPPAQRPLTGASNLTMLLENQQQQQGSVSTSPMPEVPVDSATEPPQASGDSSGTDEADTASGPNLGSSAPTHNSQRGGIIQNITAAILPSLLVRQYSTGLPLPPQTTIQTGTSSATEEGENIRRSLSSKEIGTLAPSSGSPYVNLLNKKDQLETTMRERLHAMRESADSGVAAAAGEHSDASQSSFRLKEGSNKSRNRRRAQHHQAVVDDLCQVVTDLFLAESKLLNPLVYGVPRLDREHVLKRIHSFVNALPIRYALSADTPSEVLLHMRLMAATRADSTKVAVHIHDMSEDTDGGGKVDVKSHRKPLRLVTISCKDAVGLLEFVTRLLATGGSRVLDADVMMSNDGIVLDRFVVETNGRLRLDRLANMIEDFLRDVSDGDKGADKEQKKESKELCESCHRQAVTPSRSGGPLYFNEADTPETPVSRDIKEEIQSAIPLADVLDSKTDLLGLSFPKLRKLHSSPPVPSRTVLKPRRDDDSAKDGVEITLTPVSTKQEYVDVVPEKAANTNTGTRGRRALVNRRASSNLDEFESPSVPQTEDLAEPRPVDYITVPGLNTEEEDRAVPVIPFEEVMLIESLGTGRVSTIYRAAWQRGLGGVQMVALKVAMVNSITGNTSHVDELRREADTAARLSHPHVCHLVGVAADPECFCLAYDFCEGGSLFSLLSDPSRYYEYLPIALDVANGMAYLHSRNLIHRDLKPSNILLTRDHRAKISDFGMSVSDSTGREHTAETGSYRYMAPEVIRHESYSSNADVYSFGICLWQLITREVPFATLTPIQAAYAVAEGSRPPIPLSTPLRLQEIIEACWHQDSHRRPSFTYIALALADYARMAFSPANVGIQTLQIANEMLANVEGNSTVNVDFSAPVARDSLFSYLGSSSPGNDSSNSALGLELE